jgi:isoleucyl-tRNA synthetase
MRVSSEILDRNAESYRKIRNTFRFLLGNLDGFDPSRDAVPAESLVGIDRWALVQLEDLRARITAAYEAHQYHLVYHALNHYCTVTLSSRYLDILKDRLYTAPRSSPARRAAQTVLFRVAEDVCRLMAPVLCFTAEEVWQELEALRGRPRWGTSSVHAQVFPGPSPAAPGDDTARYDRLFAIREEVYRALEAARTAKRIGSGLEANVRVEAPEETAAFLRSFGEDLRFLFITSGAEIGSVEGLAADVHVSESMPGVRVAVLRAEGTKCARCWNYTGDVGSDAKFPEACARCARAVREILGEGGDA